MQRLLMLFLMSAAALLAVIPVAPAGAAASDWKGKTETREGVLHVLNPAEPAEPPMEIALDERWRIGGDSESEDEFFGVIMEIATGTDGTVYILDTQLHQVSIYSPEGEFVRAIGHEGEGPGEFRRPGNLILLPGGNIGVVQTMPGKIVMLSPEGKPLGDYPVPEAPGGGVRFFTACQRAGDNVLLGVSEFSQSETGFKTIFHIIAVNPKGEQIASYLSIESQRDAANLVFDEKESSGFGTPWVAGKDGRVYASNVFDAYRIEVWRPDGARDRVIEREYQSRARSGEEMERASRRFRVRINNAEPERKISKTDRDIFRMFPRNDGTLWVLTSRGGFSAPKGVLGVFDVFDAEGKFVRQVSLKGQGSIERDGLFFSGERLYVVTDLVSARFAAFGGGAGGAAEEAADTEPMSVICYQLGQPLHGMKP